MRSIGFAARLVGVLLAVSPLLAARGGLSIPPGYRATILHETPPGQLAGGIALDPWTGDLVFGAGTNLYLQRLPYTGAVQRTASFPPNVNVAALASFNGEVFTGLGRSYAFPFPHEVGKISGGAYTKLFDLDGVYDFDADGSGNLFIVANPGGQGTQILRWRDGVLDTLGRPGGYSGGIAAEEWFGLFYADPNQGRIVSYPAEAMVVSGLVAGVSSTLVSGVYGSYLSLDWNFNLLGTVDFGNTLARFSSLDGSRLETLATDPAFGYGIGKAVQNAYNGDVTFIASDFSTFNSRIVSLRRVREPHDVAGAHRACFVLHNTRAGQWRFVDTVSNTLFELTWGGRFREPAVAQFDPDNRADVATRDRLTGIWIVANSETNQWQPSPASYGLPTGPGVQNCPADYNGDGSADAAVFVPSNGTFWIAYSGIVPLSIAPPSSLPGARGGIAVPGDYDGDGHVETTVYQPRTGHWLTYDYRGRITRDVAWGWSAAQPVAADYDGDGHTDVAVFHPQSGTWYIQRSSDGQGDVRQFGYGGCVAAPADYDGDLRADLAVYDERTGTLFVLGTRTGFWRATIGGPGWKAVRP